VEQRSLTLSQPELAEDSLGFFRWGSVAGKVLITNDAGDWDFLSASEFADLLAGRIVDGHARFQDLQRKGFLRDGLDLGAFADRMAQRNRHLRRGPHLHVVTLTVRRTGSGANGRAVDAAATDMSRETAETVVDFALQSTSPAVAFELQGQGGEPLLNLDVLRHLVEYATTRNTQTTGKVLRFTVLTNFSGMTEDAAEWLIANDVRVCTSLDGPATLHDANRQWLGGSAHADVVRWIEYFGRRYAELGRDAQQWHVDALATVTRKLLAAAREIVDEYVARGLRSIHLRPLSADRFDPDTWATIGYTAEEYLDFYRRALDRMVDVNRQGVEIAERLATVLLMKILTADDPGIVDLQSPSGAGTAQLAYDVDGRVFPSDEARRVDAMGDPIFELGNVRQLTLAEGTGNPTVRAIAAASLLDAQPKCAECWNKPFCGFSPVRNFISQGDLFGQRTRCFECKEHLAVSTRLFELLGDDANPDTGARLKAWTVKRSPFASDGRVSKDAP